MDGVTARPRSQALRITLAQYALLAVSAAATWASFPDADQGYLLVPALAVLLWVLRQVSPPRAAWYAGLWGFAFLLPHISWINVATGGVYFAWVLLAAAQAVFLAAFGLLWAASRSWKWGRAWWGQALLAATFWVGVEQLRARVPFGGFPWAKLAYAQVDSPLLVFAPLGGETLVSWVTVFLAALLAWVAQPGAARQSRLLAAGTGAFVFAASLAGQLPVAPEKGFVSVAAIQGNVEIPMFETYAVPGKVTGNHLRETLRMTSEGHRPELVIWGEDAIDRDPGVNAQTFQMMEEAVSAVQVPLIAGYQEVTDGLRYNWVGVWYPETGQAGERYGKQHPVPWGEYVPLRAISEFLAVEAAQVSVDMVPVSNPGLLTVTLNDGRQLPIAVGICFEAADEFIVAEGVRLGGQMILIPTNNSHFRYSAESTQQLQMLRFRAAEFGRAGLQVSTNGVSAMVNPDGSVADITQRQVAAHFTADVPLRTSVTPAAALGQVPAFLAILLTLGGGAAALVKWAGPALRLPRE